MSADENFSPLLKRVGGGLALDAGESARAFDAIMSGEIPQMRIAAFLTALAVRKPTVDEIVGAARSMRAKMLTLKAPEGAIDLCGTGGDGHGTLNVSTAVSFVVAGSGVPVAKHGNRNMSSKTGAADVLEALGVKIDVSPDVAERCLAEAKLCFLFAQTYHPAMKHVGPVRQALGFRTIFNLLGPLSNPAGVTRQLMGVFSEEWIDPVAEALRRLGSEKAWIVHGGDGLDELTTTTHTDVAALENGAVEHHEVRPQDAGLAAATLAQLEGGTAQENAGAITRLLSGEHGAFRDIVLLNASAALIIAGKAKNLREGAALAGETIDSGKAKATLANLAACSRAA
ncbi:MAG TPA: anthranilate phosphoribosyltransferase [Rhizomicrobium sp.]|nr:anthranilate phosphoribosyltransferase [Rhizomicrobium sp.]